MRARVTSGEMGTVADFFNAIIESLQQLVQQVQVAAQAVTDTAQHSAPSVHALSSEAARQAEAIQAALAQIQQMVRSIQQVAANAHSAELQVQRANETVREGDEAMNRTVAGISAIRETVAATAKKVKRLGEASQKISRVVSLISNFAAQTNLLALNAAIEAARAGKRDAGLRWWRRRYAPWPSNPLTLLGKSSNWWRKSRRKPMRWWRRWRRGRSRW